MTTPASAGTSSPSSSVVTALLALMESPLADAHYELVDIDALGLGGPGATVRVLVELAPTHPVGGRIDLDQVSAATRIVDELLESDAAGRLLPDPYTLEVSSPGLERPLRTPGHFRRAIGSSVMVKTKAGTPGERRIEGRLADASVDADEPTSGIRVGDRTIAYADIEKARIVVNWGPAAKPGAGSPRKPHPMAIKAAALAAAEGTDGLTRTQPDGPDGPYAEVDDLPDHDFDDDDFSDDDGFDNDDDFDADDDSDLADGADISDLPPTDPPPLGDAR